MAKELQRRLPEVRLVPIVQQLGRESVATSASVVGFVFPIHLTTMPYPVRDFIDRLDVSSAEYIFAAATRTGTLYLADVDLDRVLRKKGHALDAFFILNMATNSPCGLVPRGFPGFQKMVSGWVDKITPARVRELESEVQSRLDFVQGAVSDRERHWDGRSPVGTTAKRLASRLMALTERSTRRQTISFHVDYECTGCGMCERVCPSGRIELVAGVPVWKREVPCYFCYACFNCCPEQSILVEGRYAEKRGRYLHPDVTPEEIAAQK